MFEQYFFTAVAFIAGFIFGNITKFELTTWVFRRGKKTNKQNKAD